MPILNSDYKPNYLLRNGHINTIYSAFFRKFEPLKFSCKRIETVDNDFIDIDFVKNGNKKAVILCHGLEGNSSSTYIQTTGKILQQNNFDVVAMNYRFCSGEINRQLKTYHSGDTTDLNLTIASILPEYKEIYLVGFSLGGNLVLKHIGDGKHNLSTKIKGVIGISVPVDLYGSALELSKTKNIFYAKHFLKTLKKKIKLKKKQYPELNIEGLKKVKTLIDFDNYFTSIINGFKDARDYYAKSNSKQFLHKIKIPTLIINALDDPFLSESCYPFTEAKSKNNLYLMTPKYGGHVGFTSSNKNPFWCEKQILAFIKNIEN